MSVLNAAQTLSALHKAVALEWHAISPPSESPKNKKYK